MSVFFYVSTLWALGTITLLILAIRLSYKIEHRSGIGQAKWKIPVYASVIPVAFNIGVARDAQTQALRRRMNLYLVTILIGYIVFGIIVATLGPGTGTA